MASADSPVVARVTTPRSEYAEDLLSEGALRDVGLFSPGAIQTLREQHRAGSGYPDVALWSVLVMQLWHRIFVAQQGLPREKVD